MFHKNDLVDASEIKASIESLHEKLSGLDFDSIDEVSIADANEKENLVINGIYENVHYIGKYLKESDKMSAFQVIGLNFSEPKLNASSECYIDSDKRILCPPVYTIDEALDIRISLDSEKSNGLPGNTHKAYTSNDTIVFDGEKNINLNLSNIINPLSFYEFEIFKLSSEVIENIKSLGISYEEGGSWITEDDYLTLSMDITVIDNALCNCFSIEPYISDVDGYSFPYLEKIQVVNNKGVSEDILTTPIPFNQIRTFMFSRRTLSKIKVTIKQYKGYLCNVGHYYQEVNGLRFPIAKDLLINLGVQYDRTSDNFEYSDSKTNIDESRIKELIFNRPNKLELIEANRYTIGIANVHLYDFNFESELNVISQQVTVDPFDSFKLKYEANKDDLKVQIRINEKNDWIDVTKETEYTMTELFGEEATKFEYKISHDDLDVVIYDFYFVALR